MTTTRILANLFRAVAEADVPLATSIANDICKEEEKKGHHSAARLLKGALRGKKYQSVQKTPEVFDGQSFLPTALVRLHQQITMDSVVLTQQVRNELNDVMAEWQFSESLKDRGVEPRSKLLFHGPPGCGKSLTAQALGNALNLPVFMVRFDAVIGAFLGQTAIHLRQLFHFAETTPCVLLLDELDALGKRRGNPLDVGELDRIVISLLQELEHSRPIGIVIGTTNLATHLDDALWRRFDLDIEFKPPTKAVLQNFSKKIAAEKHTKLGSVVVEKAMGARNFAAAEKVVLAEVRRQALLPLRRKNGNQ
ncbi:AAA family ATPase [Polaromonas aquatica]|uniref:AAA family ATPase n=1 Tax=Polaromonas aquatica TaxID=332657 RepID=UPI003D6600C2